MMNISLAFRTLFRTPFVTVVTVVSLALGIGANAALFSIFDLVLLRPLPLANPERLVNLASPGPKPGSNTCNQAGTCEEVFSYPMFRDLERIQTVFTKIAAHRIFDANVAYRGQTLNGSGLLVSGGYFSTLGLQPALGRLIDSKDDQTVGQSPVVVLSDSYWRTRFASRPDILNETLVVNGQATTIVGVAPHGFTGTTLGLNPLVFVPITMQELMIPGSGGLRNRRDYWAYLFARLEPGVSLDEARTALNVPYHAILNDVEAPLQKELSDQTLARFRARQLEISDGIRGQSTASRDAKAPLTLLLGVTSFALLIACANIANLLLARTAARAGEMAVRLSIGASRRQLIGQLLTEAGVLAGLGGAASLLVARWTLDFISSLLPGEVAGTFQLALNGRMLLFTAALAAGTCLLFGLFPAWQSTKPNLLVALKGASGQASSARAARRFRTALATAQIALSTTLLVAAGLSAKSLVNISRADLGVKVDHVVTFEVSPGLNGYKPEASRQLFTKLEDELSALPGVTSVTNSLVPLLVGDAWGNNVVVEGFDAGPDTDVESRVNEVGTGYFQALGIAVLAGRDFTRSDSSGTLKVAIVNEAFARKFNLGANPVGRHLGNRGGKPDTEIVGLVRNAKYSSVKEPAPPVFFRPYRQDERIGALTYYVRGATDSDELLTAIPRVVTKLDPNLPLKNLRKLPEQILDNLFLDRFVSLLSAAFAVLATLLAAIGLYGVLAYTVAQRTREIGVRMALGAAPSRVRAMVLRQVGAMTAAGIALGLAAAVPIGRAVESLLYQLKGSDPVVLAGSALILATVALAAGIVPAYRASRIEPMTALRYE